MGRGGRRLISHINSNQNAICVYAYTSSIAPYTLSYASHTHSRVSHVYVGHSHASSLWCVPAFATPIVFGIRSDYKALASNVNILLISFCRYSQSAQREGKRALSTRPQKRSLSATSRLIEEKLCATRGVTPTSYVLPVLRVASISRHGDGLDVNFSTQSDPTIIARDESLYLAMATM